MTYNAKRCDNLQVMGPRLYGLKVNYISWHIYYVSFICIATLVHYETLQKHLFCLCTLVIPFQYCNVLVIYFYLFNIYSFIFVLFNNIDSSLDT
jgi:hypothetical protein